QYPEISLDLAFADEIGQFIEGGFDLAVQTGDLQDSRLKMRVLTRGQHIIVASPAYLARRGRPRSPDDLDHHDCIVGRLGSEWLFRSITDRKHSVRANGKLTIRGGDSYREAAVAGLGLAYSTRWLF